MTDPGLYLRKSGPEIAVFEEDYFSKAERKSSQIVWGFMPRRVYDDLYNIILLVALYAIQGIPIGLSFGTIPFLLQQSVSYTDLGIFSLVGYPYSLKWL